MNGEVHIASVELRGRDSTLNLRAVNHSALLLSTLSTKVTVGPQGAVLPVVGPKLRTAKAERVGMSGSNASTRPRCSVIPLGVRGHRGHEHRAGMRSQNKLDARKAVKVRKRVATHLQIDTRQLNNRDVAVAVRRKTGWAESVSGLTHAQVILRYWSEVMDGTGKSLESVQRKATKKTDYKLAAEAFYASDAWRALRYEALRVCGGKCQCCGASAADGVRIHVDHIKPRYTHRHLELDISNLQVLCQDCNLGKSARDDTDWRTDEQRAQMTHMRDIGRLN